MANEVQIKRRVTGLAGAPSALKSGELAYNNVDKRLYIGAGDNGSGGATSVVAFAASDFTANIPAGGTALQALRKTADNTGYEWFTPTGTTYTNGSGLTLTGSEFAVDFGVVAPKASPAFTGTPTAPTATSGTNSTQLATTAFVTSAIASLTASAPGVLDTLAEIATALGNDANFATTITTALAGKLTKSANLSDLTNAPDARTNLGLGSMALQAANAVNITGGTFDNITISGGTF